MSCLAVFSWLRRMSAQVLGRDRSPAAGSAAFVGSDSVRPARDGRAPSIRRAAGLAEAQVFRWLEETAKVKAHIVEANICVSQQMASIQASIMVAQAHLSDDDVVGRLALKRKIDCAEKFHQKVCLFNKVVGDVMRFSVLMPQLTELVRRRPNLGEVIAPAAELAPADWSPGRRWICQQLTRMERELDRLERLEHCAGVSTGQIAACVAGMEAVARRLTRHINEIGSELGRLVAVIDELDRSIVAS